MARNDELNDPILDDEPARRPGLFRRLFRTIFTIALLLVLALGGWSLYAYSLHAGKQPWEWSSPEWNGWWTYTKTLGKDVGTQIAERSREAGTAAGQYASQAYERVKSVEWGNIADQITTRTKELFGRTEEVEQKIEEQKKEVRSSTGGYAPQFSGPAGENYDYGLQWLEKGIAEWKVSVSESANTRVLNPTPTERAKRFFERAVSSFEQAKQLDASLPHVDMFLRQARDYLADSTERQQKIEELLRQQQGAAQPQGAPPESAAPAEDAALPEGETP
jgi:hypothetical protein